MRTIFFILMLLSIHFGVCIFIGIKWALAALALLLISLPTVFILKKDSYFKYINFVNPKYALLYNAKDDNFKRTHRITDIIVMYVIATFMSALSAVMPNIRLPIEGSIIYLIIGTVLFTILLYCFSLLIFKKSKKNSTFWFYFTALILSGVLVLAIAENFIF